MRPIMMRPIVLAASVLAAACSDQTTTSPIAPVSSALLGSRTEQNAARLPLRGSFTMADRSTITPPTMLIQGSGAGNATHLGRFTVTNATVVNLATATGAGTLTLTAANGDRLVATTAGGEDQFTPPNVSHVTVVATIVGGTGRFASATGTFIVEWTGTINFAAGTSTSVGSFDGHVDLSN
jgi:hypothetical protein